MPMTKESMASRWGAPRVCAALVLLAALSPSALGTPHAPGSNEIVVYGATPSGILAAVAAASQGHDVILIEPGQQLGGMVTSGISATDYWGSPYIQGPVLGFFRLLGAAYGKNRPVWHHEPKVASRVFTQMLREQPRIRLVMQAPLQSVRMKGSRIGEITAGNHRYPGSQFIDASYEGDLMAKAGVTFHIGRESRQQYNESQAGVHLGKSECPKCGGKFSPVGEDGRLLPLVDPHTGAREGAADGRIMNYNFRLCVTRDRKNRVPFPAPRSYDSSRFELFARMSRAMPNSMVRDDSKPAGTHYVAVRQIRSPYFVMTGLPNRKFDLNSGAVYLMELPGGAEGWAQATPEQRARIREAHKQYMLEYVHWLRHDPAVPENARAFFADFGLCADEWVESDHWPPQLYVREARRMVSDRVVTAVDLERRARYPDAILAGKAPLDSKSVRFVATPNRTDVVKDGNLYVNVPSFSIPYRAIRPRPGEASNLLVTNVPSASHIAFTAIRMEPILMGLGVAAGEAAALAEEQGVAVQDIDVAKLQARLRAQGMKTEVPKPRARKRAPTRAASPAGQLRAGEKVRPRSASPG
jgi:hypothetical protein